MTIQEVITEVDELNPNVIDEGLKIKWLNDIENTIYLELVLPREGSEQIEKPNITIDSDYSHELIADTPYSRLYAEYILSKIDYTNREYDSYNNMVQQFNESYKEFAAYYNRNHMHKATKLKNYI